MLPVIGKLFYANPVSSSMIDLSFVTFSGVCHRMICIWNAVAAAFMPATALHEAPSNTSMVLSAAAGSCCSSQAAAALPTAVS
jgi:hypothetical protein